MKKAIKLRHRKGVSAILIVVMLFTFIVSAALTVDISYMQLVRSELRAATDASAKAAAETLARTEDQAQAVAAAKQYARLNSVAGSPFEIADSDVQFGRVEADANGRFAFDPNGTPANSVRIVGRLADDAQTKPAKLFFAKALGHDDFSTAHSATASQQDVEVCLSLDRSGSMLFDMSGIDYRYAPNNPRLSSWRWWGSLWQNHLSPPHPTESRWAVLGDAVELFLDEAGNQTQTPRVGLVTWGANYTMPIWPRTFYPDSDIDVNLPGLSNRSWNSNVRQIRNAMNRRNRNPMMGGTNMSAGIDEAVGVLTSSGSSQLANKVIILLSDGIWNNGRDPIEAAEDARDAGIVIHTISMLSRDSETLEDVAEIAGGKFYSANDQAALRAAFLEIARTLPVVLTD